MPEHLECCARPAMQWAKENLPEVPFHLMFQYRPDFRALGDAVLGRALTFEEMEAARKMAKIVGVKLYYERGKIGCGALLMMPNWADGSKPMVVAHR